MKRLNQISLKVKLVGMISGLILLLGIGSILMINHVFHLLEADQEAEVIAKANQAQKIFYYGFGLLMACSVAVGLWFSSRITKRLMNLAGDLSQGGVKVASFAEDISKSSTSLSDASARQASAIHETAASIQQVSAMVKKNLDNASRSHEVAQKSREHAEEGQNAVQRMILSVSEMSESNDQIMNQVAEGNKKIGEIVHLIAEIGNKTKVINDIVFQTKLLSFNASVEAARAGEHGKGFAVVAEEVGKLAQMSGNAAKEISTLLEGSIGTVEQIISETKSGVDALVQSGKLKVEAGKSTAHECGKILSEILRSAQSMDTMITEISVASQEQSQGVENITSAVTQLNQVTEQNTAAALQSSQLADQLKKQSQGLKNSVIDLSGVLTGNAQEMPANVIQLAPRKKVKAQKNKVRSQSSKKDTPVVAMSPPTRAPSRPQTELKKVVGMSTELPMNDDPRFEDV